MKTSSNSLLRKTLTVCLPLLAAALSLSAATVRYVNINSANPEPPFTDWSTAATNIQDAVDAAVAGDEIVVTNGVYATGGRVVYGLMTNRLAVTKAVTVRSVSGAANTIIRGSQVPGTIWGDQAVRCAYLADGAILRGFTLTNGATRVFGDVLQEMNGAGVRCASTAALIIDCRITGNSARYDGGGAWSGTLSNCVIANNETGVYGGGVALGILYNCDLVNNASSEGGGGTQDSRLFDCSLYENRSFVGGGVYHGTLSRCIVSRNSAGSYGGGVCEATLDNCVLTQNTASQGGGSCFSMLTNCTVAGNSASFGGGAYSGILNNCIVYFNTAESGTNYEKDEWLGITLNYCCTTPLPDGTGNLTNAPSFVDTNAWINLHLQSDSPCINAGNSAYAAGPVDLDRNERIVGGRVDIGAYEWIQVPTHYVSSSSTNPAAPYRSWTTAATNIQDAVDAAEAGAEIVVTNGIYATGGRAVFGLMTNRVAVDKPITLRSINGPQFTTIQGFRVPGTFNGDSAIRCVYLTNGAVLNGFTLTFGATRSVGDPTREQCGGGVWCESDAAFITNCTLNSNTANRSGGGTYSGTFNNCIFTGNQAADGGGAYAGTLFNCTITGSSASSSGGGASQCTLSNCTVSSNSAYDGGGVAFGTLDRCTITQNSANNWGGGVADSILGNCLISRNSAGFGSGVFRSTATNCQITSNRYTGMSGAGGGAGVSTLVNCTLSYNYAWEGGGVGGGTLYNCSLIANSGGYGGGADIGAFVNCTIVGNSASQRGGGVLGGTLRNCIVYGNSAPAVANAGGNLDFCCTEPLPATGTGNILAPPGFLALGDSNSPCINAGNNAYASGTTDLDGNPRIAGGTIDIGAYEFQAPASQLSYAWLQQYGLPTDGSADFTDLDGDRANNWQEWQCATVPTNALSALRLLTPQTDGTNLVVRWQSVTGKSYVLERSTGLETNASFLPLATNLVGQAGTTTFTDTNAASAGPRFYRVGVQ